MIPPLVFVAVGRPLLLYQRRILFLGIAKAFGNHQHCWWFSFYKKGHRLRKTAGGDFPNALARQMGMYSDIQRLVIALEGGLTHIARPVAIADDHHLGGTVPQRFHLGRLRAHTAGQQYGVRREKALLPLAVGTLQAVSGNLPAGDTGAGTNLQPLQFLPQALSGAS